MKKILLSSLILLVALFVYFSNNNISNAEEPPKNTCFNEACHKELMGGKFKHFAAFERCSNCHKAIDSTKSHPIKGEKSFVLSHEPTKLCFTCHPKKTDSVHHEPYAKGECIKCHSPHSTNHPKQLLFDKTELCGKCHKVATDFKTAHTDYKTGNCINCHNPHASNESKVIRKPTICITCHNKDTKEPMQLSNVNLFTKLRFQHFKDVTQKCTSCHNPHHSNNIRLFIPLKTEGLEKTNIKSDVYVCFNCHKTALFTDSLANNNTRFQNNNRNLHYVHINTKKISNCNLCHQVHGTQNPHLVREFSLMGNWKNPINYIQTDSGGSCSSGCHKQYAYNNNIKISKLASLNFMKNKNTDSLMKLMQSDEAVDLECLTDKLSIKSADNDTIFTVSGIFSNMNSESKVFKMGLKPKNIKDYKSNMEIFNTYCYNLLKIKGKFVLSNNEEVNSTIKKKVELFKASEHPKFNISIINRNKVSVTSLINSIYLCLLNNGLKLDNIKFEIKEELSVHVQEDLYLIFFIE